MASFIRKWRLTAFFLMAVLLGGCSRISLHSPAQQTKDPDLSGNANNSSCLIHEEAFNAEMPEVFTVVNENTVDATLSNGRPILSSEGRSLFTDTILSPTTNVIPVRNGVDIQIRYTNPYPDPQSIGKISLRGFNIGTNFRFLDIRNDQKWANPDLSQEYYFSPEWPYPKSLYSPVMVVSGDYVIGASLQYSLMSADHGIKTFIWSRLNEGQRQVHLEFRMTDVFLNPGETRDYTLSFRVLHPNQDWLYSLVPYRNFFRSQYGSIWRNRNPQPVAGAIAAYSESLSESNPYGFYPNSLRPDIHGYGLWANRLKSYKTLGFTRIMFWAPTGLFFVNRSNNYPFPMMTQMDRVPILRDTMHELASIPSDPYVMGYWWGRSNQVMYGWDVPDFEILDPENPTHITTAFAELDRVTSLGGKLVGLDAYSKMSPKQQMIWLNKMKIQAPQVQFVTEPSNSDYLDVMSSTFYLASNVQSENRLADFLIPGHESWAQISIPSDWSEAEARQEIQRVSQMGYVPLVMNPRYPALPAERAAETWLSTIPVDLRDPCFQYAD